VIEAMYRQGWKLHLWSGISPDSSSQHNVVYQVEFSPLEGANELTFPERGVDAPLVVVRAALWTLAESAKA
jgi:hypothetical protein